MTKHKAKELENGIYRLYWKDGGCSVGAVGRFASGEAWFAPANWIMGIPCDIWHKIDSVVLIQKQPTSDEET